MPAKKSIGFLGKELKKLNYSERELDLIWQDLTALKALHSGSAVKIEDLVFLVSRQHQYLEVLSKRHKGFLKLLDTVVINFTHQLDLHAVEIKKLKDR
jgi:hypothetical protein